MFRIVSILGIFLIPSFIIAAPLPKQQQQNIQCIKNTIGEGKYTLEWDYITYYMTLSKNGIYHCTSSISDLVWDGTWTVDNKDRFLIQESANIKDFMPGWMYWEVTLNPTTLKGTAKGGNQGINITDIPVELTKGFDEKIAAPKGF